MTVPERTCIGCRERFPRDKLIRLGVRGGVITPLTQPERGRSAYLCPSARCLDEALRRRSFVRAFRAGAAADDGLGERFGRACAARKAVR